MAIVKGPALSLLASGNLGDICYSRWRELQIARSSWTGTVPNTGPQVVIQGFLAAAAQAWGSTLTAAQRTMWEGYAAGLVRVDRLGGEYRPSGYNTFVAYSVQRQRWGLAIAAVPPVVKIGAVPSSYAVWSTGVDTIHADLHYTVSVYGPDGVEYWMAGPYDSPGRRALENEYRFQVARFQAAASEASWVQTPVDKWYWVKGRFLWLPGYTGNYWYDQHYHTAPGP